MITKPDRKRTRVKRHLRLRCHLAGSQERPRLCVYRSNKHIYAQIVDDASAKTIAFAGTLDPELKGKMKKTWDREAAKTVGQLIAKRAKAKGIDAVVFDRGGYIYHGRVAAVAEAAREAGLNF
jgi:large subunit ribosomal protein L18